MKKTVLLMAGILAAASVTAAEACGKGKGKGLGRDITFEQLDTNGDGQISAAELEAFRASRFAEVDANGDGGLTAEELLARVKEGAEERAQKRVAKIIEKHDENGDGILQPAEMGGNRDRSMIDRIDQNDDGQVSQKEFDAAK